MYCGCAHMLSLETPPKKRLPRISSNMHFLSLRSGNRRLWPDSVCIYVNYANVCLHVLCMRQGWTGGLGDPRKRCACRAFDDEVIKYLECGTCCEQNIYRWHKCFSKVEKNNRRMAVAGLRQKNNKKSLVWSLVVIFLIWLSGQCTLTAEF